jgi:hypothetical protein
VGGFMQRTGLLPPFFARGAVFEGQDFAEGAQFILVPLRDLPPGADAVRVELLVDDFFDAFDLREIVVRHTSERGGLGFSLVQDTDLVLQALDLAGVGRGTFNLLLGEPGFERGDVVAKRGGRRRFGFGRGAAFAFGLGGNFGCGKREGLGCFRRGGWRSEVR